MMDLENAAMYVITRLLISFIATVVVVTWWEPMVAGPFAVVAVALLVVAVPGVELFFVAVGTAISSLLGSKGRAEVSSSAE